MSNLHHISHIHQIRFGDHITKDRAVFSFFKGRPCRGVEEVLEGYKKAVKKVQLSGPTSFAPLIREACRRVDQEGTYCILIIVADGNVSDQCKDDTARAIVEATKYPLSIVMIGVGDGPWDTMEEYDDSLPDRAFDNFQFVEFNKISEFTGSEEVQQAQFALHALMEIPDQYQEIKRLKLFTRFDSPKGRDPSRTAFFMDDDDWIPDGSNSQGKEKKQWWQMKRPSTSQAEQQQQSPGFEPLFDINESLQGDVDAQQFVGQQLPSQSDLSSPKSPTSTRSQRLHAQLEEQWTCPSCTYLNQPHVKACEACGAPRPDKFDSLYTDSSVNEAPPYFLCPITQDIMRDPVMAEDGYVYEKAEISKWMKQKSSGPRSLPLSPMSGKPMKKTLIPNHSLRSEILEWLEQQSNKDESQ